MGSRLAWQAMLGRSLASLLGGSSSDRSTRFLIGAPLRACGRWPSAHWSAAIVLLSRAVYPVCEHSRSLASERAVRTQLAPRPSWQPPSGRSRPSRSDWAGRSWRPPEPRLAALTVRCLLCQSQRAYACRALKHRAAIAEAGVQARLLRS